MGRHDSSSVAHAPRLSFSGAAETVSSNILIIYTLYFLKRRLNRFISVGSVFQARPLRGPCVSCSRLLPGLPTPSEKQRETPTVRRGPAGTEQQGPVRVSNLGSQDPEDMESSYFP